jgi:serine protease Do
MDGEEVNDINAFRLRIAQTPPGTTVRLKVFRNGSEREISVKLAELPEVAPKTGESESPRGALAGVQVDEVTSAVARQLGLPPTTRGVVVTDVRPDSPAVDAGLQPGDVIQEVNRRPISNVRGFERALREAGSGPVLLLVNRGGTTTYLAIQP